MIRYNAANIGMPMPDGWHGTIVDLLRLTDIDPLLRLGHALSLTSYEMPAVMRKYMNQPQRLPWPTTTCDGDEQLAVEAEIDCTILEYLVQQEDDPNYEIQSEDCEYDGTAVGSRANAIQQLSAGRELLCDSAEHQLMGDGTLIRSETMYHATLSGAYDKPTLYLEGVQPPDQDEFSYPNILALLRTCERIAPWDKWSTYIPKG